MLERYLADFLAFFFPQAQAEIDWQHGYTFLDKELQQVARDAALGRLADKLVQVWRHGGQETWVLVHIEVQSQVEAQHVTYISTAERMGHQKGLQEGLATTLDELRRIYATGEAE